MPKGKGYKSGRDAKAATANKPQGNNPKRVGIDQLRAKHPTGNVRLGKPTVLKVGGVPVGPNPGAVAGRATATADKPKKKKKK